MRPLSALAGLALLGASVLPGCAPGGALGDLEDTDSTEKPFSSARATLIVLELDGELTAPWQTNTSKLIKDQLFYMVGQLNAHDSVARLDKVALSNVKRVQNGDGWMKVTYHASIPVGWGQTEGIPEKLDVTLPRKIGPQSLAKFTTKYSATCSEEEGHDISSSNFWYHFRPASGACVLDPADVVQKTAKVHLSSANTEGKYPEYDQVWKDGALHVVAVFGKYTDGATSSDDAGIQAYDAFVHAVTEELGGAATTSPASFADDPGVSAPDITWTAKTSAGDVSITALLIDSPKVAKPSFDARYASLTQSADIITYNGHAGLGLNVKALASKGKFVSGQYTMFFMNGCDTFAYLDDTLWKRFSSVNPGDPEGTKHLDVLTNLMPAYFSSMPTASMALVHAMAHPEDPHTFDQIFTGIDSHQVVAVMGEEDNVYDPTPEAFEGMYSTGTVERGASYRVETPLLPAGTYTVTLEGKGGAGEDADLYVGKGYAPTTELFDEAPYLTGSDEEVTVKLTAPTKLYVLVQGYEDAEADASHFALTID
ncbi:MAG TPA: PPC domain-containing protein [Polyangiaceae bacterium]|nr:PPC domain-containing protein [Polyangiaceae bacterium]